ncbi:polycomb group protein Psc [Anopheles moucheti]|uniref:polycomb group protein Psc n=1 Tax=Anopheles moucheti TaxID=186751 RepID=UPI0022EFE742|nr:polycomb group protein Psc [Anopheles moucheti]
MVLLQPNSDVLSGDALSTSTEMASEGTPLKVSVSPPSVTDTTTTTVTTTPISISTTTTTTVGPADDVTGATAAMFGSAGPLSPYRPSRVTLGSVYPCITCNLCKGYLIDATTIVECLHSFCHSCIMKHLRTEQYCPQCEMMINKAKPNIKPDATLQAIVYKLVPGLYENELRRRRAFYRLHPEMAAIATPEQRGEDTEYLIFSPNEKISLSLEYAEKELAEDNEELLKAKYLLCPAIFSIGLLKKFIIYKYGISERQFCVEIMYKVKTIILPDYYTLMDVAYIYTWKRDAPMKYYYRIRTTESNPVELPEVPLRRSPSLVSAGKQRTTTVDDEDDKENVHLERLVSEVTANESDNSSNSSCSSDNHHRRSENITKTVEELPKPRAVPVTQTSPSPAGSPATPTPARKNESIKLKIGLNKNKYVSFLQSPQPDESLGNTYSTPGASVEGTKSHKSEKTKRKRTDALATLQQIKENSRELKIKFEKIKEMGLMNSKREGKSAKKQHQQLAVVPYKVELSSSITEGLPESERDSKRLHSSKNGSSGSSSSSYRKLKIKSPKSGSSSSNSSSNNSSPEDSKHHHPIVLKIDQRSPDMATSTLKFGVPRKTDKSMTPSPPPLPPSPPTPPPAKRKFEDEKSQFLNSFDLTPIKAEQASPTKGEASNSPSPVEIVSSSKKSPTSSVSPTACVASTAPTANATTTPNGNTTQVKRKAKDSAGGATRSGSKKPKLSDDEMKAIVEKTVAENIRSPSEHIVPPIFLKPKVPPVVPSPVASSRQLSPPLLPAPGKTDSHLTPPSKRDSPRPFVFKTPPPPPPIVSANNIPAVKPSQQVLPAPIPQKPAPPTTARPPSSTSAGKAATTKSPSSQSSVPQAPVRKPTTPTKLPTSTHAAGATNASPQQLSNGSASTVPTNATTHSVATGASKLQKPLELKRAQSNPSINILPPVPQTPSVPRDTEISKLRPEDLKKNVKIYGPPTSVEQPTVPARATDATNFAVPTKLPPKPTTTLSVTSSTKTSGTSSTAGGSSGQGTKGRPLNYLNYALLNSKAAAAGSRTPIPSYSSNSPSYSPDSPQYNPNLNFSPKQFKYANPLAYNSHLQNMLNDRRTNGGSTSPPSATIAIPASSPSPPQAKDQTGPSTSITISTTTNKRPASALSPDADEKKLQPPEKQAPNPPNPLDKFPSGIPDGLSVTLATEEDDAARIKNVNKQLKNNFIEIRALPEIPMTAEMKLPMNPNTGSKQDRRTPPSSKAGTGASGNLPTTTVSQMARKSTPPINPTYSVANSVPVKTSPSAASSNGGTPVDAIQRKIYDLIEKQSSSDKIKSSQTKPPTLPPVSRPSTPKGSAFSATNNNKLKNPNATVHENGLLKLNNYREVDLIPKGVSLGTGPIAPKPLSSSVSPTGASRMMPPPAAQPKSIVPIAPKPSQQSFANGRMAMSPPIQRSPTAVGGYHQPKSKTPPSHLPSMASMGPMFAAIGTSGGTPSKKPPVGASTTLTSGTVPRRKIVPTNNSTTLVPLKSSSVCSPASANGGGSKIMSSSSDFITLHPQGPTTSSAPSSRSLPYTNPQQAALSQMFNSQFARQFILNSMYNPYSLHQYAQLSNSAHLNIPNGSDSVTITASPMNTARNAVSQNTLTVTAIPAGSTVSNGGRGGGPNGGNGSGNSGGGGGPSSRGYGGGGPNPASRNSS